MPALTALDLGSNVGICGERAAWREGLQVRAGLDAHVQRTLQD